MSSRHRSPVAATMAILLLTVGFLTLGPTTSPQPAVAAPTRAPAASEQPAAPQPTDDPLDLRIDSLSPTYLGRRGPVTVTGQITNPTQHTWTDLKVYLVMPSRPLTSRGELNAVLEHPTTSATGSRIIEKFANAANLAPGDTTTFRLRVPHDLLPVSAASGVYPIGAQVLATDDQGNRSDHAVGRAYTLLPSVQGPTAHVSQTAVVWPFTSDLRRRKDGTYHGTGRLMRSVAPGGRLRRLLDLARSSGSDKAMVLLDPLLLDALDDIAHDSFGPPSMDATGTTATQTPAPRDTASPPVADTQHARTAKRFLDDLVAFAKTHSVWAPAYGWPDMRALTKHHNQKAGRDVAAAASAATSSTLGRFDLDARQVFWPAHGLTSARTLGRARDLGARAAIVSPAVVSGWDETAGSMQRIDTDGASIPVVVDDPSLMNGGTQGDSALETRQRLASEAALEALEGGLGPDPVLTLVVDPDWDPGANWAESDFYSALDAPWVHPIDAEERLGADVPQATIELPSGARPSPISHQQVRAAARIVRTARRLASVIGDDPERRAYYNQAAGLNASQDWRSDRLTGIRWAEATHRQVESVLGEITVETTPFVTLSGTSGRFPITITNNLDTSVRVGVRIRSDNPSLSLGDIKPTTIGPNQSKTVTVNADVGKVSNSAVTARLVTRSGTPFGKPADFSVRSSVVGVVIWIGMGIAGLLVVAAVARQVLRRRSSRRRGVARVREGAL